MPFALSPELSTTVLGTLVDGVVCIDDHSVIVYANPAVERLLGWTPSELVGQRLEVLLPPAHTTGHAQLVHNFDTTRPTTVVGRGRPLPGLHKDGRTVQLHLTVSQAKLDGRRIFAGVLRDLTAELRHAAELRRQRDDLRIQARINDIVQRASSTDRLIDDALQALIEMAELKVQAKVGAFLVDDRTGDLRLVRTIGRFSDEFLRKEARVKLGCCLCGRAAETGKVLVSNSCFSDPRDEHTFEGMTDHGHYIIPLMAAAKVLGVIFLYTDPLPSWDGRRVALFETIGTQIGVAMARLQSLEQLEAARAALAVQATRDALTGAWNRRAIRDRIRTEISRARRTHRDLAVAMLDLDHFKRINDTWGHPVGDGVLKTFVSRARAALRSYDDLGRYGGEEFVLLVCDPEVQHVEAVLNRVRAELADRPVEVGDVAVPATVSIGATLLRPDDDIDSLLARADAALYTAKETGRNRVQLT